MKAILILIVLMAPNLRAADLAAGQSKAQQMCLACHGPVGLSPNNIWPNLAGQKEKYLADQLMKFRSNRRFDEIMSPITKLLSDADIANLSAYYASLSGAKP